MLVASTRHAPLTLRVYLRLAKRPSTYRCHHCHIIITVVVAIDVDAANPTIVELPLRYSQKGIDMIVCLLVGCREIKTKIKEV
jgi:hypothetical protein